MKNKSTKTCYDSATGRWSVSPRDVVVLDLSSWDGTCYPAYVDNVSTIGITVVRISDRRPYTFTDLSLVNRYVRFTPLSKLVYVRADNTVFSTGELVLDSSFEGSFKWIIDKFDFDRSCAFVIREISGRTIGHWCDVSNLVKVN